MIVAAPALANRYRDYSGWRLMYVKGTRCRDAYPKNAKEPEG